MTFCFSSCGAIPASLPPPLCSCSLFFKLFFFKHHRWLQLLIRWCKKWRFFHGDLVWCSIYSHHRRLPTAHTCPLGITWCHLRSVAMKHKIVAFTWNTDKFCNWGKKWEATPKVWMPSLKSVGHRPWKVNFWWAGGGVYWLPVWVGIICCMQNTAGCRRILKAEFVQNIFVFSSNLDSTRVEKCQPPMSKAVCWTIPFCGKYPTTRETREESDTSCMSSGIHFWPWNATTQVKQQNRATHMLWKRNPE